MTGAQADPAPRDKAAVGPVVERPGAVEAERADMVVVGPAVERPGAVEAVWAVMVVEQVAAAPRADRVVRPAAPDLMLDQAGPPVSPRALGEKR